VRIVSVETRRASPFASSLLFDYIAAYMYEGDAPLLDRRAQALALIGTCCAALPRNCGSCWTPRSRSWSWSWRR
jgi:ATP-dependent Lhr-like helicase